MFGTVLGFVIRVFAGRAGLFVARILAQDGTTIEVQVSDLDGEPERFNERLTKVRLFREAMNNAEPVLVKFTSAEGGGNEVESVERVTRDHVAFATSTQEVTCLVLGVSLEEHHGPSDASEKSDVALVVGLSSPALTAVRLSLAMQRAERSVATAMFETLSAAVASGQPVRLAVAVGGRGNDGAASEGWIVGVHPAALDVAEEVIDGFVESISARVLSSAVATPLMQVLFTTAPKLLGPGRAADPTLFEPKLATGLVAQGSPMLRLLQQALESGQRVRVGLAGPRRDKPNESVSESTSFTRLNVNAFHVGLDAGEPTSADPSAAGVALRLIVGVTLLAPLASAARPVWVQVHREALDGSPLSECVEGMPTSDLSPRNVASLQVPHRAAWEGVGCFNHGVYRIQVVSPVTPRILVDGKELACVETFEAVEGEGEPVAEDVSRGREPRRAAYHVFLAHACLGDLHTVRVEVEGWRCGYRFLLDVMKLR